MLAIVPFQVDVGMSRWPIANFLLIATIIFASFAAVFMTTDPDAVRPFILDDWSLEAMVGHMFLHAGPLHLLGNMIFLWTFGNAVCATVGNLAYIPIFLGLGIAAAAVHNLIEAAPAVGASGAINGIVGMYLIYFPRNNVTCFYWFVVRIGTFYVSSFWIILLFFAFDAWGAYQGGDHVAHWAHIGGLVAGMALASVTLLTGLVEMRDTEDSLLKVLGVTD